MRTPLRTKVQYEPVPVRVSFVRAGCSTVFVQMTKAPLRLRLLTFNPQHCTWRQKHLTQNLQIAGGQGDPCPLRGHHSRAPCPLHAFFWVLVLLYRKIPPCSQTQPQNKGSSNPPAPRLTNQRDVVAAVPPLTQAEPRHRAEGSRFCASTFRAALKGPVSKEFLQLPGNGEREDLVSRQKGAQSFATQVL